MTSPGSGGLSYNDGQIARLSNPNLTLGAGATNGSFTSVFDIDNFAAAQRQHQRPALRAFDRDRRHEQRGELAAWRHPAVGQGRRDARRRHGQQPRYRAVPPDDAGRLQQWKLLDPAAQSGQRRRHARIRAGRDTDDDRRCFAAGRRLPDRDERRSLRLRHPRLPTDDDVDQPDRRQPVAADRRQWLVR